MKMAAVKAKISEVQGNGTWQAQHGLMYSFHVTFSDGLVAEVNSKTEVPRWSIGDEVWYTTTGEWQGRTKAKIDLRDPSQFQGRGGGAPRREDPETQRRIENSWALQTAIQMMGPMKGLEMNARKQQHVQVYLLEAHRIAIQLLIVRDRVHEQPEVPAINEPQ